MTTEASPQNRQNQPQANQFYTYIDKKLLPWDPYAGHGNPGWGFYFGKVLQIIDRALPNRGLIFYITMVEMQELPSYGSNVFVLILGDEFYRIPNYVDKVGGIFKCYGTHQIREQLEIYRPLLKLSYFKGLLFGQSIKNLSKRIFQKVRHRLRRMNSLLLGFKKAAPIYDIPPGYFNSENLPIKPINSRSCDVFFDGSIVHAQYPVFSLRHWSKTPKTYSREQMFANLKKFQDKYPQFQIKLTSTSGFAQQGEDSEPGSYSQKMMNAKVCLVPRGTTLETYRLFEAMRYGCIIISEILPFRWFYDGAPIVQIGSWDNLESVLTKLLGNEMLLEALHQQTLDWWHNKCSEEAIGWYCAEKINQLLSTDQILIPVSLKSFADPGSSQSEETSQPNKYVA